TGVAVLSLATALAQTAPLALHLGSAIPFGTYPAPVVPRLSLRALWWNSERLLHGYRGYWQAPIFHPDPFAFAYTEPQWLSGLVAGALWWTTARPALAYDAVVLIAFTLNGCCGHFLLRRLRIGFWPALCGGLVIEMLPFVADQIGVLQSTVLFPIPMSLACLVGFGRTGSAWSALGGVLWMAVCYHTSANTALFFGPAALLALLVFGGRRPGGPTRSTPGRASSSSRSSARGTGSGTVVSVAGRSMASPSWSRSCCCRSVRCSPRPRSAPCSARSTRCSAPPIPDSGWRGISGVSAGSRRSSSRRSQASGSPPASGPSRTAPAARSSAARSASRSASSSSRRRSRSSTSAASRPSSSGCAGSAIRRPGPPPSICPFPP